MVEEKEKTLDYIKLNKNDFIIHSIGYGKNFDRDFIETISSMTNKQLNDYIKQYGSKPKPVVMCRIIDRKKEDKK